MAEWQLIAYRYIFKYTNYQVDQNLEIGIEMNSTFIEKVFFSCTVFTDLSQYF